jgi:histidine triad (HIT) family protein
MPTFQTSRGPGGSSRDGAGVFCDRMGRPGELNERLVCEDEFFHASHQLEEGGPTYLGLLLLQTKAHTANLGLLSEAAASRLGLVISRLSRALIDVTGATGTYCFGFTEAFRHVHLVLVARYPDVPPQYMRLAITDGPDVPKGGASDVAKSCRRIRTALGHPSSTGT